MVAVAKIQRWLRLQSCYSKVWSMDPAQTLSRSLSVQFSRSVMSDSLRPHDCSTPGFPVHHQLPELTETHVHWVGDAIQPSHPVIPFSSHLQSFPASRSFLVSQFFASGGQSIGVSASASVFPMDIQDWLPLGLTSWISLQPRELSRVFSNTTVQSINSSVLSLL